MDLCPESTEPPSLGLKSTSKSSLSQRHGRACEDRAAQWLTARGYQVIKTNHRIAGIEIDLVVYKDHWVLVEVKSLSHVDQLSYRLSYRQKERIRRAQAIFGSWKNQPVEVLVVYVPKEGALIAIGLDDH